MRERLIGLRARGLRIKPPKPVRAHVTSEGAQIVDLIDLFSKPEVQQEIERLRAFIQELGDKGFD